MSFRNQSLAAARIAAILFDAGDILYDATPGRRRLLRVLARMGLHTQYACFFRIWERNFLRDVYRGQRCYLDAFRALLASFGFSSAQTDEVEAAVGLRRDELEAPARLLPAVRETLARPELVNLRLGILTNSTRSREAIEARLAEMGIAGRFRWIFSSIDQGAALPDRGFYRFALQAVQSQMPDVDASRVAFVGHDGDELAGAAMAGMPTIAFNYEADAVADVYLESFHQLPGVIEPRSPLKLAG